MRREFFMKYKNNVYFRVFGKYALFTDPLTKIGGEKFSYEIPTYSALKGVLQSIYWKPTFIWIIDEVKIMKPIQTQSVGVRPIHYHDNKNDLSVYTYLYDVEYLVKAHFEWAENRPELKCDRNETKHWLIAKRMIEKGGRRDIFLGTRECQAYVEPCDYENEQSAFYSNINERCFGVMVHGITYADEQTDEKYKGKMTVRLWRPVMKKGIVCFDRPDSKNMIIKEIRTQDIKKFIVGQNFSCVEDLDFLEE